MQNLPVPIGFLESPQQLIDAWDKTIRLLDQYPEQQVAHTMASQALNSGHDEWRRGPHANPTISEVTEILLNLETPDGSPEWRAEQWQHIRDVIQ